MKGSSSRRGETEESVWRKREMMLAGQGGKDWGPEQEGGPKPAGQMGLHGNRRKAEKLSEDVVCVGLMGVPE